MQTPFDDDLATDDHPVDAVGELARLVVRGVRAHAIGVEDDHVGNVAVAQEAAVGQAEARAAAEVIERTASGRLISASSRTNWPRTRGNEPYVRGDGFAPTNVESVPIIPTGWRMKSRSVSVHGPGVTWLMRRSSSSSRSQRTSTGSPSLSRTT